MLLSIESMDGTNRAHTGSLVVGYVSARTTAWERGTYALHDELGNVKDLLHGYDWRTFVRAEVHNELDKHYSNVI